MMMLLEVNKSHDTKELSNKKKFPGFQSRSFGVTLLSNGISCIQRDMTVVRVAIGLRIELSQGCCAAHTVSQVRLDGKTVE